MKKYPQISVVTVVYNGVNEIESTICSVLDQLYTNVHYVVIDGGSTDGTLACIEKYRNQIDIIISEPDEGIYDAMNKGIGYCTGEWVNFMNCGDVFYSPNTLLTVFSDMPSDSIGVIYGKHKVVQNGKLVEKSPRPLQQLWKGMTIQHQSTFVRSSILKSRFFNTRYLYAADYDIFYECFSKGVTFKYIDEFLSKITAQGFSESNSVDTYKEFLEIALKYNENPKLVAAFYKPLILNRKLVGMIRKLFPFADTIRTLFIGKRDE